jgi:KDO2-lipid IV(A) lauroyltransferase
LVTIMSKFYLSSQMRGRLPAGANIDGMLLWAEAAVPRLAWWLARWLPTDRASGLGAMLGRMIGPHLKKHGVILGNLQMALPALDERQREVIARDIWAEAGRVMVEFALIGRICGSERTERLEFVLHHDLSRVRDGTKPAMYFSAHLANFELGAAAATLNGVPLSIVWTPQGNPLVEAALRQYREVGGCRFLPSRGSLRRLIREVQEGRSLGWIIDQRHDRGDLVPFFGVDTPTAVMPAMLALRLHCDLVPVRVERLKGARFRITAYEPLSTEGLERLPQPEAARELTRRMNGLFEGWIRERPGQWLCFKRRWPQGHDLMARRHARSPLHM